MSVIDRLKSFPLLALAGLAILATVLAFFAFEKAVEKKAFVPKQVLGPQFSVSGVIKEINPVFGRLVLDPFEKITPDQTYKINVDEATKIYQVIQPIIPPPQEATEAARARPVGTVTPRPQPQIASPTAGFIPPPPIQIKLSDLKVGDWLSVLAPDDINKVFEFTARLIYRL